ncbi:MAG TPA: hypothetical protein VMX75_15495 [Spirochaetia bacterium]|nr:hypothetical protein [Spirochaetia bacterium]
MPAFYPMQYHNRFGLGMGVTYSFLRERFGFNMGERFHRDMAYRIETCMEIDRSVYGAFKDIGIGFEEPFPRATVEPFGHGFIPIMYGCECVYSEGQEPAVRNRDFDAGEIEALEPWTRKRFEESEAVREVARQFRHVAEYADTVKPLDLFGYNPHYQPLGSLQNLGSVINNAHSIYGQDIFILYADNRKLLKKLYGNITDLMLHCLDYFPQMDGRRLSHVFVGDCTVSMISPDQYRSCNLEFDRRLSQYAREAGARFLVHQDSGAAPHLENFSELGCVHAFDLGQDTDFGKLGRLFPDAGVNCILFPAWLESVSLQEIRSELARIMEIGLSFSSFTFSMYHIDSRLAQGRIFEFYDIFKICAEEISKTA